MKVIKPGHEILVMVPTSGSGIEELRFVERLARTCYQSEPREPHEGETVDDVTRKFISGLINRGHEAMLEHGTLSVSFICDRGVSHELVRHRMASFAQESTRYCNYSKQKFGSEITFIAPCCLDDPNGDGIYEWTKAMMQCEESYFNLLNLGYSPQEARAVLPNSLKTEIVVTANYREWRHILKLRCAPDAHPQMKELMIPLLIDLKQRLPTIFGNIDADWEWYRRYKHADNIEVFENCVVLFYKPDEEDKDGDA